MLKTAGAGFGYLALAGLLGQEALAAAASSRRRAAGPEAAALRRPRPSGSSSCSCKGPMSQMDTFEYKPQLQKDDGKVGPGGGTLTASKFKFAQHGQTRHLGLRTVAEHGQARRQALLPPRPAHRHAGPSRRRSIQLHTGTAIASLTRPSMGAWLLYGLGTENQDLPGYITINPPPNFGGAVNYGSAFLPAHFQGTRINDSGYLPNLQAADARAALQRKQLDLIQAMNRDLAAVRRRARRRSTASSSPTSWRSGCRTRCRSCSTSAKEPQSVLDAYGVKPGPAGSFARQCLMARRLSEAGVRFVEICQPGWDHHSNLHKGLISQAARRSISRPRRCWPIWSSAACWTRRWCCSAASSAGMPTAQGPDGRDHNITGYPDVAGRGRREAGLLLRRDRRVRPAGGRGPDAHRRTCTRRCWP